MATDNPLIAAFVSDDDDNEILISTSNDGVSWSGNTKIGQACKGSPSLAFFNGKYWLAFRAHNKTDALLVCSSPDGVSWSGSTKVNQSSQTSPSLTVFKNQLWMAFVANDHSDRVLLCSSSDGEHWSDNTVVNQKHETTSAPSLVAFDKQLWLAFISSYYNDISGTGEDEGAGLLYLLTSSNGTNWTNQQIGGGSVTYSRVSVNGNNNNTESYEVLSKHSPDLFVFNKKLWLSYINPNESADNHVVLQSSSDGVNWPGLDRAGGGQRSPRGPNVALFGSTLVMGYIADNDTNSLLISTSSDGKSWSNGSKMGQASDASPALAWKGN